MGPTDDLHDLDQLFRVHSRRRFVEQQNPGFRGQRTRHLHPSLGAVGQIEDHLIREAADSHHFQKLIRPRFDPCFLPVALRSAEEGPDQPVPDLRVLGHLHVLEHGHVSPQEKVLEGPADAHRGDPVRRKAVDLPAVEKDLPFRGRVDAGDEVEDGGLSRAVRADQPPDLTDSDLQVVVLDGPQPAEVVRHPSNPQERHVTPPGRGPVSAEAARGRRGP